MVSEYAYRKNYLSGRVMKTYRKHEEYRFSYMKTRDLWTRLGKIKDREKLYWFGKIAAERAAEYTNRTTPNSYLADEYHRLSKAALEIYNKEYKQELTTFLDPKLFEWEG
jgi:hypothetical protein